MKYVLVALAVLIGGSSSALARESYYSKPFYGVGRCFIETKPCENGRPISCNASGTSGGNCSLTVDGEVMTVDCVAYGYGSRSYSASCVKAR